MARFFLPPDSWSEEACLLGDEAKHLSQVLRIRTGDTVTVFDGAGRRALAVVRGVAKERVNLQLGETILSPVPAPRLLLAIAIPKGKTMDLVVQKAVELGVSAIQPLVTRRTIVQPGDGKADKWRRVALEACKQCGTDFLPEVFEPADFQTWLSGSSEGLRLIASLAPGARSMREVVDESGKPEIVTVLIGPEGDFTPEEISASLERDFLPVTLGTTVLRTETAALFAISAMRYAFTL